MCFVPMISGFTCKTSALFLTSAHFYSHDHLMSALWNKIISLQTVCVVRTLLTTAQMFLFLVKNTTKPHVL